jgi:hypothetical protein
MTYRARFRAVAIVGTAALLWTASAFAGGSAVMPEGTVPQDLRVGETWVAELRALNCGVLPEEAGMRPWMAIENVATGERIRIRPKPVRQVDDRTMIYAAEIAFPTAGSWRYSIGDRSYSYGWFAIHIRAANSKSAPGVRPKPAARPSEGPLVELSAGGGALVLMAFAAVASRRRKRWN